MKDDNKSKFNFIRYGVLHEQMTSVGSPSLKLYLETIVKILSYTSYFLTRSVKTHIPFILLVLTSIFSTKTADKYYRSFCKLALILLTVIFPPTFSTIESFFCHLYFSKKIV